MATISYTTIAHTRKAARQALKANIADQWERVEAAEKAYNETKQAYTDARLNHSDASLALTNKFPVVDVPVFNEYVWKLYELAYAKIAMISNLDKYSQEQDKYNELVIKMEDWDLPEPPSYFACIDIDEDAFFADDVPDVSTKRRKVKRSPPASPEPAQPEKRDRTKSKESKARSMSKKRVFIDLTR